MFRLNFRLYGKPGEQPASPPSTVPSAGQDANTLLANASSAYAMHDYGSAIPLAIRVTEMYPQAHAWNLLGLCYLELDELQKAEDAFQRQIDVSPQSSFAYNNLGRVYARQRKFDMAIAQFRKQIEINPRDRYAHMNLAGSLRSGRSAIKPYPNTNSRLSSHRTMQARMSGLRNATSTRENRTPVSPNSTRLPL